MRPGPGSRLGIRGQQMLLVAAAVLPILLVSAGLLVWVERQYRASVERGLVETTQALAIAMERQIDGWQSALQALATSPGFDDGDLATVYRQAQEVAARHGGWIVVFDRTGQQRLNTLRPWGEPLPKAPATSSIYQAFATGEPMVTGLFFGRVAQRWIVSLDHPVARGGQVPYFVTMSFEPTLLSEILAAQELPGGQIAAVVDENNKVVARSRDIELRLGKDAPAWFAEAVAGRETGVVSGTGSLGGDYVTAFQRLDNAPWLVNVGAPLAELRAEAGWPLPLLGAVALATLAATAGLVWALSRRLTTPVAQLAGSAGDLLEGRPLPPLAVPELERLRRALVAAGEEVRRGAAARERAKAADELATVNATLEQRLKELSRSERQQKLLVDELQHRVKNTLTIVQALARQTLRGPGVDAARRQAFEERLHALATVHDLLSREGWESMDLGRLVAEIVAPHCAGDAADRIRPEGPDVRLAPDQALALGIVLHELCTNAVKHGALSREAGLVTVTWSPPEAPPRLRLEWRETGGPPPAPGGGGFGSRLVERMVRGSLRGRVEQEWRAEGLVCRIEAPLAADGAG